MPLSSFTRRMLPLFPRIVLSALAILLIGSTTDAEACVNTINSDIIGTVTWSAGCVYVIEQPVTQSGGTFKINPGVIVKFKPGASLTVTSTLHALGAEADSVIFTSYYDDDYGGDTNGDGSATTPSPGDWDGILFTGSSAVASVMDYSVVRYAGSTDGSVRFHDTSPVLRRTRIFNGASAGIYLSNSSPQILGTYVHSCSTQAILLSGGCAPKYFSTFYPELSNVFAGNGADVVAHTGGFDVGTSTWRNNGYPYHILSTLEMSYDGSTLTLDPGLVVKVATGAVLQGTIFGHFKCNGTVTDSIVFTSINDDSYGGDSNKDGSATTPAPGDWGGVWIDGSSLSVLEYCHVRYAGGAFGQAAVQLTGRTGTSVRRCLVSGSSSNGIYIDGSSPKILGNTITGSTGAAVAVAGTSSPEFFSTSYPGLTNFFVYNGFDVVTFAGGPVRTATWHSSGYPWHVLGSVDVISGTLDVEPGLVIKMAPGTFFAGRSTGHIKFVGTSTDSVIITSVADDSYGGDSNKDGSATTPAPGDWDNLRLDATVISLLEYCNIRYGGSGGGAAVEFSNGSSSPIRRCLVSLCASDGVSVDDSSPFILGNHVAKNGGIAVRVTGTSSPYFFSGAYPGLSNLFAGNSLDVVAHDGGTIGGSTWRLSGYPWHVLSGVQMNSFSTLHLEPGLIVKMAPGTFFEGVASGHFDFAGTQTDSIVITSVADDSYGGDSNRDGSATTPAPGDWDAVRLIDTDTSLLEYCRIRFAGQGGNGAVHFSTNSNSTLRRCLVTESASNGVNVSSSTPTILGNRIENNAGTAVAVSGTSSPFFFSVVYPALSNTFVGNGLNVVTHGGGTLTTCTWRRSGYPWHVLGPVQVENNGSTLILDPGLVVKMTPGSYFQADSYGHLQFVGTSLDTIVITSVADDAHGGDSNSDGSTTQPAPGDWDAVRLAGTDLSLVKYCSIHYGGQGGNGAVFFSNSSMSAIRNSIVGSSSSSAVRVSASNPTIEDNEILSTSATGIFCENNALPEIHYNSFIGDPSWIAVSTSGSLGMIDAENNWWNHDTGPYDPSPADGLYNPGGQGAQVGDAIDYVPFTTNGTPDINLGPTSITRTMMADTADDEVLNVQNAGSSVLSFTVQEAFTVNSPPSEPGGGKDGEPQRTPADVPWLSVNPSSGDLGAGQSQPVSVNLNAASLSDGTHTAYLEVASNDPDEPLEIVPITLDVWHVVVTAPYDSLEIVKDGNYQIAWQHSPTGLDSLSIDLSMDGGNNYSWPVASGLDKSTQMHDWLVDAPESDSCKVKVTGYYQGAQVYSAESEGLFAIIDTSSVTGIHDPRGPQGPVLWQNTPNPFNPATTITFSVPEAGHAELVVFDVRGARVTTLVNEPVEPGIHTVRWSARDASGTPVRSGLYFYRLRVNGSALTRKMILLK